MINKLISQIVSNQFFVGATIQVVAPGTCEDCPFEYKTREPYNEIWNDPSEAHYICELLNKEVWGENPECEPKLTEMLRNYLSAQHSVEPTVDGLGEKPEEDNQSEDEKPAKSG